MHRGDVYWVHVGYFRKHVLLTKALNGYNYMYALPRLCLKVPTLVARFGVVRFQHRAEWHWLVRVLDRSSELVQRNRLERRPSAPTVYRRGASHPCRSRARWRRPTR